MRSKFAMELRASLESDSDGIDALATDAPVVTTDEVAAVVAESPVVENVEVEVVALPNEVADEVVVDNSDSLEEAVEETAVAETAVDNSVELVEELDDAAAGLESIYTALQGMQKDGKVDSVTLRATNLAIESYATRVGLNDRLNVSAESFSTTASMESIKETLKKMWETAIKFLIEIKNKVVAFLKRVFTATGRLEARAKKLAAVKLESGEPAEKSFVVKGLAKRLAVGKQVPVNPTTGLFDLINTIDSCLQWDKDLADANEKILGFLKKIAESPLATSFDAELNKFNDIKDLNAPKGFTKIDNDKEWGWKSPLLPGNVRFVGTIPKQGPGTLLLDGRTLFFGAKIVKEVENVDVAEESSVPTLSISSIKNVAKVITGLTRITREAQKTVDESLQKTKSSIGWKDVSNLSSVDRKNTMMAISLYKRMNAIHGQLTTKVLAHAIGVASAYLELAERSAVQYAKAGKVAAESMNQMTYSEEGIKGAVQGFLIGTAANLGGAASNFALPGASLAVVGAVDAAMKTKRQKLKQDIEQISKRIADLKNGDIEKARKEGLSVSDEIEKVDYKTVIKSALLGNILPFYTTYQGHKAEELQKELAAKIVDLKIEFARHGINT